MMTARKGIKQLDMTQGRPAGLLISFAIPIFLGNVFQQLYNIMDSVIVGRFVGADALAAVGVCSGPYSVFVGLNMGLSTGVGILVAQLYGAGKEEQIKKVVANALILLMASALITGGLGFVLAEKLLVLLGTPESVMDRALIYMRTVFVSILGMALYHCVNGILRALGDSRTPLFFLALSSVLNIVLDVCFVTVVRWDVFGVAFATLLSQLIAAGAGLIYARKKYECFRFPLSQLRPHRAVLQKLLYTGLPLALQSSTINISAAVLQGFVNSFGETVVAANTIINKFDNLNNMPLSSLSMALSTYTGQNVGAGQKKRVQSGYRVGWMMAIAYSVLVFVVGHVFGGMFADFFVQGEPEVRSYSVLGIGILSCGVLALSMIYVNRSILNGAGDTGFALFNGTVEIVGRIGFAWLYTVVLQIGPAGLWLTAVSNWLLTGLVCQARYLSGVWKRKGEAQQEG